MRIERIRSCQLGELGDIDWKVHSGPCVLICSDASQQTNLVQLLLKLFYDPTSEIPNQSRNNGSLEVWLRKDDYRFYIRRDFTLQRDNYIPTSLQVDEETTGHNIMIPVTLTVGDYIFGIDQRSFLQGAFINWPEMINQNQLKQRINNLCLGGDEGLSPIKAQSSLKSAQKKVNEQKERMALVKAEYDALRRVWEESYHWQDEKRLLQIEITKLQESEAIVSEKIEKAILIQERLELLNKNRDYRKLRELHSEIINLKELISTTESTLQALSREPHIDWPLINDLREDCIQWARHQKRIERLAKISKNLAVKIAQIQYLLKMSGIEGSNDEAQRLQRIFDENNAALEELNKLNNTKAELERLKIQYSQELEKLHQYEDIADITKVDEIKIAKLEKRLRKWRELKIGNLLDKALRNYFKRTTLDEILSFRLRQYYEHFHVPDFEGYVTKLTEYHNQQEIIQAIRLQIEQLHTTIDRERILHERINSRSAILNRALAFANVEDFSTWLKRWEDCQRRKRELSAMIEKQQVVAERYKKEEEKLHDFINKLQEKLTNWNILGNEREEVLAVLYKVAAELRIKDKKEKQAEGYVQRFQSLLGNRSFESLKEKLEPLAELEQEEKISPEDRNTKLKKWESERREIQEMRLKAEQRLKSDRKFPSLLELEERIESLKHEWISYEGLQRAIKDAQAMLETSINEWQEKYGNLLHHEMTRIITKFFTTRDQKIANDSLEQKNIEYFAYRMAIAYMLLGINTEVPLLFSVNSTDLEEKFWVNVINCLTDLSYTRQIILITSNNQLGEKFKQSGWSY